MNNKYGGIYITLLSCLLACSPKPAVPDGDS